MSLPSHMTELNDLSPRADWDPSSRDSAFGGGVRASRTLSFSRLSISAVPDFLKGRSRQPSERVSAGTLDTPELKDPGLKDPALPSYAKDASCKGWAMKQSATFPYGWHKRYFAFGGGQKTLLYFSVGPGGDLVPRGEVVVKAVEEGRPRPLLKLTVSLGPAQRSVTKAEVRGLPAVGQPQGQPRSPRPPTTAPPRPPAATSPRRRTRLASRSHLSRASPQALPSNGELVLRPVDLADRNRWLAAFREWHVPPSAGPGLTSAARSAPAGLIGGRERPVSFSSALQEGHEPRAV